MTSYSDRLNIQYFLSFVKEFHDFFSFRAIHIKIYLRILQNLKLSSSFAFNYLYVNRIVAGKQEQGFPF